MLYLVGLIGNLKKMELLKHTFLLLTLISIFSCEAKLDEAKLDKADIIFHAGSNVSGFSGTFFSLYKHNKYKFCDGDFMDPGCYTGDYILKGDTIILKKLKLSENVKSNRFIIYRYTKMDSSEGDIFELDEYNNPKRDEPYYYVMRHDKLKDNY